MSCSVSKVNGTCGIADTGKISGGSQLHDVRAISQQRKVTQPLRRPYLFYLLASALIKTGKNFIPFLLIASDPGPNAPDHRTHFIERHARLIAAQQGK